jgi:L-glyceraldehyde 3-phosphate reductase
VLEREGIGCIAFSPLAQGLLSNRYLKGIPADARAAKDPRFLTPAQITPEALSKIRALDAIAQTRGQSLAQMALSWVLRRTTVTSALVGASNVRQLEENVALLENLAFGPSELEGIERILSQS